MSSPTPALTAAVRTSFEARTREPFNVLLVATLALALFALAIASVPPRLVRWHPVAHVLAQRQLDLAIVGLGLLLVTGLELLLTRAGP